MNASPDISISQTTAPVKPDRSVWAILGFALLCLSWGGTWLPLKHGVAAAPPLLFVAGRFLIGGLVLWLAGGCRPPPPLTALWPGAVLMIAANYGPMAWGAARVPTGLAATVNFATVPLAVLAFGGRRPRAGEVAALVLGAGGLGLLGYASGTRFAGTPAGLGAIALGAACYGLGTVLMKRRATAQSPVTLAAWHSLVGGALLLGLSGLWEPWDAGVWQRFVAPATLVNSAILILLGTVIGFSLYLALLRRWPASAVASYAYVCPVMALTLGVLVEGERPTPAEWIASLVLIGAAALALVLKERP